MKNMKKALSALTALALGSTAAVSVVACNNKQKPTVEPIIMSDEILKALELMDDSGNSVLEIELSYVDGIAWAVNNAPQPNAALLLNDDSTAKSEEIKAFLTETLGLVPDENELFSKEEAEQCTLQLGSNIKPILIPNTENNGYTFTEGTINGEWRIPNDDNSSKFVAVDGIKLKQPGPNANVIIWPESVKNLETSDFDASENFLQSFGIGTDIGDKEKWEKKDITEYLNINNPEEGSAVEYMKSFIDFFKDLGEIKIATTTLELKEGDPNRDKLDSGDKLHYAIYINEIGLNLRLAFELKSVKNK